MSNFIKFSDWLKNKLTEDMTPPQQVNPAAQAANAKKAQLATTKYKIDMSKLSKDPKAMQQAQARIVGDPQFGPEVAASIFKNM